MICAQESDQQERRGSLKGKLQRIKIVSIQNIQALDFDNVCMQIKGIKIYILPRFLTAMAVKEEFVLTSCKGSQTTKHGVLLQT